MKTNNTKNDVNLMTSNQMENTHKDSEVITTYNTLRGENSIKLNSNMNVKKNDFIKGFQWFKSIISIFVIIINLNS